MPDPRPRIIFTYDDDGEVYTNIVEWKGETIQVISNPQNAATRELQRSDEIARALLKTEAK